MWQRFQMLRRLLDRVGRAERQIDTELPQGATQAVDSGSARLLPLFPQPVQLNHCLLHFGFERHRLDIFTAPGFEQGIGIATVSFVSPTRSLKTLSRPDMRATL